MMLFMWVSFRIWPTIIMEGAHIMYGDMCIDPDFITIRCFQIKVEFFKWFLNQNRLSLIHYINSFEILDSNWYLFNFYSRIFVNTDPLKSFLCKKVHSETFQYLCVSYIFKLIYFLMRNTFWKKIASWKLTTTWNVTKINCFNTVMPKQKHRLMLFHIAIIVSWTFQLKILSIISLAGTSTMPC